MHYKSPAPAEYQWSLDIDLQADLSLYVYTDLKRAGYSDADEKNAVYQYYNLRKRQIEPKPRRVVYSKQFSCPEEYQTALKEFENKTVSGADLTPFQSDKINKADFNDMLLNDWGIQHFHLSRRYRKDGFAARSKYQIFAYITDEVMYMIRIFPHDAKNLYSKKELVRIIRDNWPELIERFHVEDVLCLTEKLDDHAYSEMRKANMTTFLELGENEVYGLIGGGYASNGFSIEALRNADFWLNRLGLFQLLVRDNAAWIIKTINKEFDRKKQFCHLEIKLLWIDSKDKVTMFIKNIGLILQANSKEHWLRLCEPYELFGENIVPRGHYIISNLRKKCG